MPLCAHSLWAGSPLRALSSRIAAPLHSAAAQQRNASYAAFRRAPVAAAPSARAATLRSMLGNRMHARHSSTQSSGEAAAAAASDSAASAATAAATGASASTAAAAQALADAPPGFLDSYITFPMQDMLAFMHHTLDIPWWGTVVLTTAVARILLFPLYAMMQRNGARMRAMQPEIERLKQVYNMSAKTSVDLAKQQRDTMEVMAKANVNPFSSMAPMIGQMPVFITFFWAFTSVQKRYPEYVTRVSSAALQRMYCFLLLSRYRFRMYRVHLTQLSALRVSPNSPLRVASESFFWISNVSVPDPSWMLPAAVSAIVLAGIELGADGVSRAQMGKMIWGMRLMMPITFYFATLWPALFGIYLGFNSIMSLAFAQIVKVKAVRKLLNIPAEPVAVTVSPVVAGDASSPASPASPIQSTVKITKAVAGLKLPDTVLSQKDLIRQRRAGGAKKL
jgi:YidC/Oxa1 family membrane protein insertase